jgi:hypothetical protein
MIKSGTQCRAILLPIISGYVLDFIDVDPPMSRGGWAFIISIYVIGVMCIMGCALILSGDLV